MNSEKPSDCDRHIEASISSPSPPTHAYKRICHAIDDAIIVFDVTHTDSKVTFHPVWKNGQYATLIEGTEPDEEYQSKTLLIETSSWETHRTEYFDCVVQQEITEFTHTDTANERVFHTKLTPVVEDDTTQQVVAITREITSLNQRDAKYHDLFEASRDALMILDDSGFQDCNTATLDLFQISSRDTFSDTSPWELSPDIQPDGRSSRTAAEHFIEEAFETGSAFFEWKHQRADGSTFDAEVKLSRFETDDGPALHSIVRDITDRKTYENHLSALQSAMRSFVQAQSKQAIADQVVATAEELLGFSLPSVWFISEDQQELQLVANSANHQVLLEEADTPEPTHSRDSNVWEIARREETVVWSPIPQEELAADVPIHSAIICPLGDHGLLACAIKGAVEFTVNQIKLVELLAQNVEVALDEVSHRKALQQQQEFTNDLIDAIEDVVYVLDRSGSMVMWNDAMEAVTGYDSQVIETMDASDFFAVADDEAVCGVIDEAFVNGRVRVELDFKTATGENIPYEFLAQTFEAPTGDRVLAGIGRDRTVHVEYEALLEEQRDNLKLLNQVVRHDIRNDLMVIDGYAGLVEDHVNESAQDHVKTIRKNAKSAVSLTNTARDLTDVILSNDFERQDVQLIGTLEHQVEDIQSAHPNAIVTLTGNLNETLVIADEMLDTIFRNVLQNAIQHNDKSVPEVDIFVEQGEETVNIHVADNGPGIPDDRKVSIFGKGEKGFDSPGTGLGLYLVQTLIDRYGGSIEVRDNEPEGAILTIEVERS